MYAREEKDDSIARNRGGFPRKLVIGKKQYFSDGNSSEIKGGNGRVRVYSTEEGTKVPDRIVCKMFDKRDADLLREEKMVAEYLRKDPKVASNVVEVLSEGTPAEDFIVLQYVTTPLKVLPGRLEWSDDASVLTVFADYVETLQALRSSRELVFLDATLGNFGYATTGNKRALLIDLGAFHVLHDDRFDPALRPSFVPPQMWEKNIENQNAFCTVQGEKFTIEELRAVGYYACFCECLGVFLEGKGHHGAKHMMHTETLYKPYGQEGGNTAELAKSKKAYETMLTNAERSAPEMVGLMRECLHAELAAGSENRSGSKVDVAEVVRRAAAWAREHAHFEVKGATAWPAWVFRADAETRLASAANLAARAGAKVRVFMALPCGTVRAFHGILAPANARASVGSRVRFKDLNSCYTLEPGCSWKRWDALGVQDLDVAVIKATVGESFGKPGHQEAVVEEVE